MYRDLTLFICHSPRSDVVYSADMLEDAGIQEDDLPKIFTSHDRHILQVVSPFTTKHDQEVEAKLIERQADGTFHRNGSRYFGALVEVAVQEWTFPQEPTEKGFHKMEADIGQAVGAILNDFIHKGGIGSVDFLKQSLSKLENSSDK